MRNQGCEEKMPSDERLCVLGRVFQLKEMSDKEQNIEKKKVSVIFWTVGKNFFETYIKLA